MLRCQFSPVYIREEKNLLVNIENWISGDEYRQLTVPRRGGTAMRRMREDHLHRNYSDVNERPIRCRAKLIQPKAGMAACLAMIPSAYNGTSCPATAASNGGSSERSSEGLDSRWALPGAGSFNRPTVREVVSNRTEQKNFKKYNEGRSISGYSNMLPTKTGAALCFYLPQCDII